MFWKLLLAFTILPAVEIYLLVQVGRAVGALSTVVLVLATGVLGAAMAKREGTAVLRSLVADLKRGLPPATRLVEGALVLAGGLLLISPGVLTDLAGIALLLPWPRRWLAPVLTRWLLARFRIDLADGGLAATTHSRGPEHSPASDSGAAPFDHPVS